LKGKVREGKKRWFAAEGRKGTLNNLEEGNPPVQMEGKG